MKNRSEHLIHAMELRADILAAPQVWLPRREVLIEWLNGFVGRAEKPRYELADSEAADLTALEHFLRTKKIPVAQR